MTLRSIFAIATLAGGMMLSSSAAWAWGHQAHAAIDRAAIAALPADGPTFLKSYSQEIGDLSTLPDTWRRTSEPFSRIEEDPNHGWFRERFTFLHPLPRSRYAFILALYRQQQQVAKTNPEAAKWINVRWTGTLPYAAMEQYGHLVSEFRQLRAAQAEANAPMVKALEDASMMSVVRLGHYIGDGAQPLHDSMNSDGWIGPDPKGYTRSGAIHGLFETTYVAAIDLTTQDVMAHMQPLGHQHADLFDGVIAYLNGNGAHMEEVFQLEKRGALADPKDKQARALIYGQTGLGASMLRDMIYRAWRESASDPQGLPNPLDTNAPDYDPATGSAPPPVSAK